MTIPTNATYTFNTIYIKLLRTFFTEIEQNNLQFVWKYKRLQITKPTRFNIRSEEIRNRYRMKSFVAFIPCKNIGWRLDK